MLMLITILLGSLVILSCSLPEKYHWVIPALLLAEFIALFVTNNFRN